MSRGIKHTRLADGRYWYRCFRNGKPVGPWTLTDDFRPWDILDSLR